MHGKMGGLSKCLAAYFAFVWLFACVNLHMVNEMGEPSKSFAEGVAFVRFLASVCPVTRGQVSRLLKTLFTVVTLVWSLTGSHRYASASERLGCYSR